MKNIEKVHRANLMSDAEKEWWDKWWEKQQTADWASTGGKFVGYLKALKRTLRVASWVPH